MQEEIKKKKLSEEEIRNRFPDAKRGYWFTPDRGDAFLYIYNDEGIAEFYRIDEQEQTIMKINEECIKLVRICYRTYCIEKESLEWLIDESKSKLKYFKNIEELVEYEKF